MRLCGMHSVLSIIVLYSGAHGNGVGGYFALCRGDAACYCAAWRANWIHGHHFVPIQGQMCGATLRYCAALRHRGGVLAPLLAAAAAAWQPPAAKED